MNTFHELLHIQPIRTRYVYAIEAVSFFVILAVFDYT